MMNDGTGKVHKEGTFSKLERIIQDHAKSKHLRVKSNSSGSIDKADVKQVISKPKINTQRLFEGKPGYSRYKDNQSEKKTNVSHAGEISWETIRKSNNQRIISKQDDDLKSFLKDIVGVDDQDDFNDNFYAFPPITNKKESHNIDIDDEEIIQAYSKTKYPLTKQQIIESKQKSNEKDSRNTSMTKVKFN